MQRARRQGVSIQLIFDRSYINTPVEKDDWGKIKRFLDVFLYDIRFVEVVFAPPFPVRKEKAFALGTDQVGLDNIPPRIST